MTPRNFDGAIYSAAIAGGECFGVFHDRIETLTGTRIPSCPAGGPLAPQAARVNGKLCLAGKGHADGLAWLWNGSDWLPLCPSHGGMNTCAFGPLGVYVSTPTDSGNIRIFDALSGEEVPHVITKTLGVEGIALVTGSGIAPEDIHPTKEWYGKHGFGFYTEFVTASGVVRIGQGANGGLVAKIDDGPNKLLEPGDWQFITVTNVGEVFSVAASQFPLRRAAVRWFSVADIRNAPDVGGPIVVPPPPPPPPPPPVKPMYRSKDDILPYMTRRWAELGIPAKVKAICQQYGILTNKEMTRIREKGNAEEKARKEKCYNALRAIQIPAFFQSVGEMYAVKGWRDVGLGRKTSGNNWENKATDIIVLKPLNGVGQVLQADALSGSGYPEAKPMWDPIPFNSARTWVEPIASDVPPEPEPDPEPDEPGPDPNPALLARIAALEADVRRLDAENARLREIPAHPSYDDMMAMLRATQDVSRWTLPPETAGHFTWRFLLEGYTVDQLVQEALDRQ